MATDQRLRELPEPVTPHGPATSHVSLGRRHEGQIVTPVVRAWHKGKKQYLVQLSFFDASDRTYAEPVYHVGDYWSCVRWLETQQVQADVDAA